MEKEFIPYEQALALKELGFDEDCLGYYTKEGMILGSSFALCGKICNIILYQQAFRWLREVHSIDIIIQPYGQIVYRCRIYKNGLLEQVFGLEPNYEILLEEGLQKGLKLIPEIT